MRKFLLRFVLPVLLVLWGVSALYTVDQSEFVYVTRFGELLRVHDGSDDAGLHVKLPWPIDSSASVDRRLQLFDLPPTESLTRDPKNQTIDKTLAVDAYVCWRVPDPASAEKFIRTCGTVERAEQVLGPRIAGRLAAVISNMPLDSLVSVATPAEVDARGETIRRRLLGEEPISDAIGEANENLRRLAADDYGIEIVDVRLRRFNYPEAVRATIAERIRSERRKKVAEYESEGRLEASRITSNADREARGITSTAQANRRKLEGEADVEADQIRNAAHAQDPEFYAFLKKMRAYQDILAQSKDVLLLSSKHELFDMLLSPPKPTPGGE